MSASRKAPGYRFGLSHRHEGDRCGTCSADPVHPGRRRGRARPVGWQAGREPAAGNPAVAARSAARACRLRATRVMPGGARRSGGSWRPWMMVRSWPAIRRARPSWSRRWLSSRRGKGSRAIVLIAAPFAGEGGWPAGEFGPAGGRGAGPAARCAGACLPRPWGTRPSRRRMPVCMPWPSGRRRCTSCPGGIIS